mgnify:CR=1 FL=1
MEDYWPNFEELVPDMNHSLDILRQHAESLPLKTKGKVMAVFSQVMQERVLVNSNRNLLGGLANQFASYKTIEILDNELKDKQDVNKLFTNVEYKFDIYNESYRFRVLKLKYNIVYPITVEIDDDIAQELNKDVSIQLSNDLELKELLKSILNSKKLISVIGHIMTKDNQSDDRS